MGISSPTRKAIAGPAPRAARLGPALAGAQPGDTRRYYDDNASAYAAATQGAGSGAPVEDFVGLLPRSARVVDLGSGAGRDLAAFVARGIHAVGLDTSASLAAIARARSGAPVVVADMTSTPFGDSAFDGAWASASLLHLGEQGMARALSEARRIVRPGGVLFTSMKEGVGQRQEPCGRWFSYVNPTDWLGALGLAGFEVLNSEQRTEHRRGAEPTLVPWLTCLARRR